MLVCGIAGFIGKSKNSKLTYKLISALFRECEIRGDDASGYWGTNEKDIFYHKEPIKSSDFVKKDEWLSLYNHNLDMLLVHARGASLGVGSPVSNKNNHPFTSTCKSIGLVHNGRVPDFEYDFLTKKYEVTSSCDSEIILRIFEAGKDEDQTTCRLSGLRDIWSHIDKGHMAVAIGERVDSSTRKLFLFRNKWRSLWLADVRRELGQIFFFSTVEIWNNAFKSTKLDSVFKTRIKKVELPTEQLWILEINEENPIVKQIDKFKIEYEGKILLSPEGDKISINKEQPSAKIHTTLDESDEVLKEKSTQTEVPNTNCIIGPSTTAVTKPDNIKFNSTLDKSSNLKTGWGLPQDHIDDGGYGYDYSDTASDCPVCIDDDDDEGDIVGLNFKDLEPSKSFSPKAKGEEDDGVTILGNVVRRLQKLLLQLKKEVIALVDAGKLNPKFYTEESSDFKELIMLLDSYELDFEDIIRKWTSKKPNK